MCGTLPIRADESLPEPRVLRLGETAGAQVGRDVEVRERRDDHVLRVGTVDFDTAGTDDSDFTFRGNANPAEVVSSVDRAQRVAATQET